LNGSAPSLPVSSGFTGYDWQVVAISHGGKVTNIPARLQVGLRFSPGGQFGASDGVNFHSGTYRTTGDGFTTSILDSTLVGYGGHDPAVLLAISVIGSFDNGVHVTVKRIPAAEGVAAVIEGHLHGGFGEAQDLLGGPPSRTLPAGKGWGRRPGSATTPP
jgi:hypothetical protein